MKKNLSIKDISKMTGISIATVSRVINGNGRYSKETEEKVKAVIKEYNYTPNMIAKGLRTKKMDTIGIVVPDITNEFFTKLIHEMETSLFAASYSTFICNTNENVEIEQRYLKNLRMQNVSGIIYISGASTSSLESFSDIPMVFIDRVPKHVRQLEKCVVIESDNTQGGYLATKELLSRGCRKIIMLTDKRQLSSHQERVDGFIAAHNDRGAEFEPSQIIKLDSISFRSANEKVKELLDSGYTFDGIFASTDWLAMGAYVALVNKGITIPEQVKLVGFDDISVSEFNALPISTIHQQVDIIGQIAVKSILRLIEGKPSIAKEHIVPVYLVKRKST